MKRIDVRLRGLAMILWVTLLALGTPAATPAADDINVLFVGNSFTINNNMPKMIEELAKAGKQRSLHTRIAGSGSTLEKGWNTPEVLTSLRFRKWDYVVLQEHMMNLLDNRQAMIEYGKKFDAEIKKQEAKTLLYVTFAYKAKPTTQATITKANQDLAKEIGAGIAPVGVAWELALAADKQLDLHDKDGRHPNPAGSYLAACVFYATIYGKSPEGLPAGASKLQDAEARRLQASAWKAVQESTGKSKD